MKSSFNNILATYSDLETLVLATEGHSLKESLLKGEDIHKKAACCIFGLSPTDVREKHRNFAKSENFKHIYSPDFTGAGDIPLPDSPTHCARCLRPFALGCKCHES